MMMVTERAHADAFLRPHNPQTVKPVDTRRGTSRLISGDEDAASHLAEESVPTCSTSRCAQGCDLPDEASTSSRISGIGGASIQSNLQPVTTVFGAPAQVLYKGTGAFVCDSQHANLRTRGGPSPISISPLYLPSYVQGSTHPSGKQLPQLSTRFCQTMLAVPQSMPELSTLTDNTGDLDSTQSENLLNKAKRGRIPGSWSKNKILSQIKSKKLMNVSFGRRKGEEDSVSGASEGKCAPEGSGHDMNSVPIVPRAVQCLQSEATCLQVSWSHTDLHDCPQRKGSRGLFGKFREGYDGPRDKKDTETSPVASAQSDSSRPKTPSQAHFAHNAGSLGPLGPYQWAEMFAGEDRGQVVITGAGHTFIGVFDGFMDCAAVDFLMAHLYPCVADEIEALCLAPGMPCQHSQKEDPIHRRILEALEKAYARCEGLFLEMVRLLLGEQPELAVAGACVAAVLVMGPHLYVLNIGDCSAVLVEGSGSRGGEGSVPVTKLTVDHNTNNQEEVLRVFQEHQDDPNAVEKGRVKGKLRVTRAFGGAFMKEAQTNANLFSFFSIKYVGDRPYLGSKVHLRHQPLTSFSGFLVIASDGLYQHTAHAELPGLIEAHRSKTDGGSQSLVCQQLAQGLVREALQRAANKSCMSAETLAEMLAGESRRKIHDDVTIVVLKLET